MSKWDKMDKKVWENSKVMNEFEKIISAAVFDIKNKIEAQQEISKKLDTINKGVESTSKGMNNLLDMAKNLAEDDLLSEEPMPEPTEEEQMAAKAKLLEELNELAAKAADERNYKLAYQIERAVDFISEV